jgi:hypothetical protein
MPCQAGPVNLAAALRHHARDPARPLTTLGILLRSSPHERTFRENAGALGPSVGARKSTYYGGSQRVWPLRRLSCTNANWHHPV